MGYRCQMPLIPERRLERIVLFAGPSRPLCCLPASVEIRPPVKRGDLIGLANDSTALVVLADGMFFHQPALTHVELMLYLQKQTVLIGTASMGALRATELRSYGMVGVGTVFSSILDGTVTDDEELAVAMCPYTYSSLTIPRINLRRFFFLLREHGCSSKALEVGWNALSAVHFLERTPERLGSAWHRAGITGAARWQRYLKEWDFDVKAQDTQLAIGVAEKYLHSDTRDFSAHALDAVPLYRPSDK